MTQKIAWVLMMAMFAITAAAQTDGNPANWCRNGAFPSEIDEFRIGTVKAAKNEKVYFYNDFEDECPTSEKCKEKSYVVSGDKLVVSRTFKGFVCSWYSPAKGIPTVGWIKQEKVEIVDAPATPALSAWMGNWRFADNTITLTHNKLEGDLNVTGEAFWKGFGDNIHIGELDHRAEPKGTLLKAGETDTDEYACKVSMQLIGSFLVVKDNMNCGGMNVTFSGVYRRASEKPRKK